MALYSFLKKLAKLKKPNSKLKDSIRRQSGFENLERREMMAADGLSVDTGIAIPNLLTPDYDQVRLTTPVLNSNLNAKHTLYLDFDGHIQDNVKFQFDHITGYETPVVTDIRLSRFSMDTPSEKANKLSISSVDRGFSTRDIRMIHDVWTRVSEDFAPFDVNVTTVEPSVFDDGQDLRIVIGGPADYFGGNPIGGKATGLGVYSDTKTDITRNVAFVLSDGWFFDGVAKRWADTADELANVTSHEAGHMYGLHHIPEADANGNILRYPDGSIVNHYSPGDSETTPIMGNSYQHDRTIWTVGATEDEGDQDSLSILEQVLGARPDDHGGEFNLSSTYTDLGVITTGLPFAAEGIIGDHDDIDSFRFSHSGGTLWVQADVLNEKIYPNGANLDLKVSLTSINKPFQTLAISDPKTSLGAGFAKELVAGEYIVSVESHGGYGDLGQYTLDVAIQEYLYLDQQGRVYIHGSSQSDTAYAWHHLDGQLRVQFVRSGVTYQRDFRTNDVNLLVFYGHDGADVFGNFSSIASWAFGGLGNDYLQGGSASDRLYGGGDSDVLKGGAGEDHLYTYDDNVRDHVWGGLDMDFYYVHSATDDLLHDEDEEDVQWQIFTV